MTGFICHDDYLNKTAILSDEQLGKLFRACMKYHATGELESLGGLEGMAFEFIRFDIDKTEQAYQEKCEKNRQNRLSKLTIDNDRQRSSTNDNDPLRTCAIKEKKRHIKEKTINNICRFAPPTLDEVTAYCQERNNQVDPQQFIDFYASKGWKVGNQPMKDWKACVRTWERRDSGKTVNAQKYEQRDYRDVQEEMMRKQNERVLKRLNCNNFEQRDYSDVPNEMLHDLEEEVKQFKASGE